MSGIEAIRLVTRDARALAAFYEAALGLVAEPARGADPFGGEVRLRLRLGAQAVELVEIPRAAPAPPIAASDLRFQHLAMIAPDMGTAMERLESAEGWSPIGEGGPQTLPEASGGVTAFKFRDSEGHPLEILSFPAGAAPEPWRAGGAGLLGIDHTAIVVTDTDRSVTHYERLGWTRSGGSLNRGPEQARLDGVAAPVVEVTTLRRPAAGPPPHLELLRYREGAPASAPPAVPDDAALATRTRAGGGRIHRDPDGHRWLLPAEPTP